jgi:hypothetical protein
VANLPLTSTTGVERERANLREVLDNAPRRVETTASSLSVLIADAEHWRSRGGLDVHETARSLSQAPQ